MRLIKDRMALRYGWMCMVMCFIGGVDARDSLPPIPKRLWVLVVGPSWSQAFGRGEKINKELFFPFYTESYYRRLQPYVSVEMLAHRGERVVYGAGLSYHERYTDNLYHNKYLIRSINIEGHGGFAVFPRTVRVPYPYYWIPNVDTVTSQGYLTAGMYIGYLMSVKENYGRGPEVELNSRWDVGLKLRLFGQYYKYRPEQKFLSIQVEFAMGLSLLKIQGYYVVTNYSIGTSGAFYYYTFLPQFRLSVVL